MKRRRCSKHGHRFRGVPGVQLPYEFCTRWFCPGARVADWVSPALAEEFRKAIPEEGRR